MRLLLVALAAMFVQQTVATIGRVIGPIIAPAVIDDLAIDAALVGVYSGTVAAAGMVSAMGCGGFIVRFGALRISQIALVLIAIGLAVVSSGWLGLMALGAIIVGTGSSTSTPASSHLLSRFASPKVAPLVFSLKQTAVPAAYVVLGLAVPALVAVWGWRGALGTAIGLAVLLALLLQPLRATFDTDRQPTQKLSFRDFRTTLASVGRSPALKVMALAGFSYSGLQAVYTAFLVLFLTKGLGYDLSTAGLVLSTALAVSVPARIFWGWLAGRLVSPQIVLAALGVIMAGASAAIGMYGADWPVWAVIAVSIVFSATAISWHGVLLSEVARLAPPGQVGPVTGGVLGFTSMGQMVLPLLFSALLATTGSYRPGFWLLGLPALATAAIILFRKSR
ncbi:MAG: MFS transporter [Acetobacterales bacterium]